MNIPLLREIQAYILDEPKRFRMDSWCEKDEESPCGTTLCIAGAALTINAHVAAPRLLKVITETSALNLYKFWGVECQHDVEYKAATLLGLTNAQSQALFYDFQWPATFRTLNNKAETAEARAAVGVARIEHLIQTGE